MILRRARAADVARAGRSLLQNTSLWRLRTTALPSATSLASLVQRAPAESRPLAVCERPRSQPGVGRRTPARAVAFGS